MSELSIYAPFPYPPYVQFIERASYSRAVRTLTERGLQIVIPCNGRWSVPGGRYPMWIRWGPVGQRDHFQRMQQLWIEPTPLAAAEWLQHLGRGVSGVQAVLMPASDVNCPIDYIGTPPPDIPAFLTPDQAGTYARVTFGAPVETYDAALLLVTDLGLRLADPAYEHARARGAAPVRELVGQERQFLRASTMTVATTPNASTHWHTQLQASVGVQSIEVPFTPLPTER